MTVAVLLTWPAGASAVVPRSLGVYASPAVSDGKYLVAGRGTVSIFDDRGSGRRTASLPDAAAVVTAASSGTGVWRAVADGPQASYGLLDLRTGTARALPGASKIGGLAMLGEMGSQWLQVLPDRGAFRLNWHTGLTSQAALPKRRHPQTALNSPVLSRATQDPYVTTDAEIRYIYRRGSFAKRISGDCRSCGDPVVVGRRVAWIAYRPSAGGSTYWALHTVNTKTGRSAVVRLSRFPGATPAALAVQGASPPQLTATANLLVLSVSADRGATWTAGGVPWPV